MKMKEWKWSKKVLEKQARLSILCNSKITLKVPLTGPAVRILTWPI